MITYSSLILFNKIRIKITNNDKNIFIYCIIGLFLSRGAVFYNGLSVDDYILGNSESLNSTNNLLLSQGRLLFYALLNFTEYINTNITDIYMPFAALVLVCQSLLVTSIFRFTQMSNYKYSEWTALLSILHPYHTEIITFKAGTIIYSFSIILFCASLEYCVNTPKTSLLYCAFFLFLGLLFYQIIINYIIVTCIISYIIIISSKNINTNAKECRRRVIALTLSGCLAVAASWAITSFLPLAFGLNPDGRAQLISVNALASRFHDVIRLMPRVFIDDETIAPQLAKIILLIISFFSMYLYLRNTLYTKKIFQLLILFIIYLLFTPGISVLSKEWWPVPRVLNHATFLYGVIILLGLENSTNLLNKILRAIIYISCGIFILVNAQIFSDQSRINRWDGMLANRILTRLENHNLFRNTKYLYIDGGKWKYNSQLRTIKGDMNISAFYPSWSKIYFINKISGYNFLQANNIRIDIGHYYCLTVAPWPSNDAVTIINDLGIVCLEN